MRCCLFRRIHTMLELFGMLCISFICLTNNCKWPWVVYCQNISRHTGVTTHLIQWQRQTLAKRFMLPLAKKTLASVLYLVNQSAHKQKQSILTSATTYVIITKQRQLTLMSPLRNGTITACNSYVVVTSINGMASPRCINAAISWEKYIVPFKRHCVYE